MINCTLQFSDYRMHAGFAAPDKSLLSPYNFVPMAFETRMRLGVLTYGERSVQCRQSGPCPRGDSGCRGEESQKAFRPSHYFSDVPNCFTFTGSKTLSTADGSHNGSMKSSDDSDRHAFNRLRRALVKVRKCVDHYAGEFCDELHKDYASLIKCWQWTREIHHLLEIGLDLDDRWPEVATDLIGTIVHAEELFLAEVKQVLRGGDCDPLLECGFWAGYDDPVWGILPEECDTRLKAAGASATRLLECIDDALRALDFKLGFNSFPNGTYCSIAANANLV